MATVNLGTEPGKKRRRRRTLTGTRNAPRYGKNEQVKGGTYQRSRERLKRTGPIRGVDASDGITGREARKIKRVDRERPRTGHPGRNRTRRPVQVDPFEQEVDALTQLQFGGQERELQQRTLQEQQMGVNQQAWYAKHVQDLQLAQAKQQAFAAGVQAAAYGAAQNAATTDQNQNNSLIQQAQQSAAQRGTQVDPALIAQMQQGVAARQVMGNAGGNLLAAQGQAQSAFMGNQVVAGSEQGLQAQADTQARQRRLAELAEALASDKGAFKVKARADIQERQHKQNLENAAFGLDVQQEANDQANSLRDDRRAARKDRKQAARDRLLNAQTRESIRTSKGKRALDRQADLADDGRRNYSTNYSEWAQRTRPDKPGSPGGPSNFTPTQLRANRDKFQTGMSIAKRNSGKGADWLYEKMVDAGYPALMARVISLRASGKYPTGTLNRRFQRQYGFKVRGGGGQSVDRPPNATAPGGNRPT